MPALEFLSVCTVPWVCAYMLAFAFALISFMGKSELNVMSKLQKTYL